MNKLYKKIYMFITFIFMLLTLVEFVIYILNESNYFGFYYLLISIFTVFMIIGVNLNYAKADKKIRLSKSIIIMLLTLFCSFLLPNLLNDYYSYIDNSQNYIKRIYMMLKFIKPLISIILVVISALDFKQINISNYKINNHNK